MLLRGKLQLSSFSGVVGPIISCDGTDVGVCVGTESLSGLPSGLPSGLQTFGSGVAMHESIRSAERGSSCSSSFGADLRQHTVACHSK